MSCSDSALAVMYNNHDNSNSNSNDYPTRKEKFHAIHQDIAKLIVEEQIAAATDSTSILNAITESPKIVKRSE